jgi:hypothetical protein
LTGILGGISMLQLRGLARENSEQAAIVEVLIRDGAVVLVAGSETG